MLTKFLRLAAGVAMWALTVFAAVAADVPKEKQTKLAKYLTAKEAYEVVKAEGPKTLFIDVRTRAELQFVGMTHEIDGQVAFVEMSEFGEWDAVNNRFKLDANPVFSQSVDKLLTAKGLTKADRVVVMCRSGDRSARAINLLADAGYTNAWNQVEGFEGDMSKDGRRDVNGWKNAGLPWTYKLDKAKVSLPAK
jgi:rhodanese-related sulfurtransferase